MAKHYEELLIDDIDGGAATQTVHFGLGNVAYEIDLSDDNANQLRDGLAPFIEKATKVRTGGPARMVERRVARGADLATVKGERALIRAWALEQGLSVATRGAIPATIIEAYARRNSGDAWLDGATKTPRTQRTPAAAPPPAATPEPPSADTTRIRRPAAKKTAAPSSKAVKIAKRIVRFSDRA